jgi:hypothetical protein
MMASSRRYQPAPDPGDGVGGAALAVAGERRLVMKGFQPQKAEQRACGLHTLRFGRIFSVKRFSEA